MLIFIISCVALVVGVAFIVWAFSDWDREWAYFIGVPVAFFAFVVFAVSGVGALDTQIHKDIRFEEAFYLRENLEYRLEHKEEDVVGNEHLYNDIIEFNNDLRSVKYYCNNPWVNWFYNDKIATLDYIELKEVNDYASN